MENNLKVFYLKAENPAYKGKRKFVYVSIVGNDAEKIQASRTIERMKSDRTLDEVHLTTDGAWERYCEKRKGIPKLVKIFNTQKELEEIVAEFGYVM